MFFLEKEPKEGRGNNKKLPTRRVYHSLTLRGKGVGKTKNPLSDCRKGTSPYLKQREVKLKRIYLG